MTIFTTGSSVCKWPNQIGFESFVEIGAGEERVCVCTRANAHTTYTRTTRTSGAGRSERGRARRVCLHAHSRTRAYAPETRVSVGEKGSVMLLPQLRQNLYYCASTASNQSTCFWQGAWCVGVGVGEEVAACAAACVCLFLCLCATPGCRGVVLCCSC